MRRGITLLAGLAIAMLVGGSALAGYSEVTYDLAGSTLQTVVKSGTAVVSNDTDVVTGTWRLRLVAATKSAPLTANSPRIVAGTMFTDMYQPGAITISGKINTTLLPPQGGTTGTLAGNVINFNTIPDSNSTGYQHCTGALCTAFAGTASVNAPLTPATDPLPSDLPNLNFFTATGGAAATAPAGSSGAVFTTDQVTNSVTQAGLNIYLYNIYRGQEIDRYWISGDVPAMGTGALVAAAALLVLGGTSTLMLRRRS